MSDKDEQDQHFRSTKWYELFSRGARDWLRHDEKVREPVRENLPQIVAGADVINEAARTVRVPVRMLEHYHFRLRRPEEQKARDRATPSRAMCSPVPTAKARARKARADATRAKCSFLGNTAEGPDGLVRGHRNAELGHPRASTALAIISLSATTP